MKTHESEWRRSRPLFTGYLAMVSRVTGGIWGRMEGSWRRCSSASGAEGCRFEPYRAYQPVNNLAGLAVPDPPRGQAGDKSSMRTLPPTLRLEQRHLPNAR